MWKSFNNFFVQLDEKPDNWEDRITLFVGYLINDQQAKSQTVKIYVSAMKAALMDIDVEVNEDRVLLVALTKACKFRNDYVRTRLPIQKILLIELIRLTGIHFMDQNQPYLAVLHQALFSTAYFGLFRVSEITLSPSDHIIQVTDVHMGQNKKKILFVLRSSKTHRPYAEPQMIKISSSPMGT